MDAVQAEARFLDEARRGTVYWRRLQRWGLYLVAFPILVGPVAAWRLFQATDADSILGPLVQVMAALAFLVTGYSMWQYGRTLEGAALHLERAQAP